MYPGCGTITRSVWVYSTAGGLAAGDLADDLRLAFLAVGMAKIRVRKEHTRRGG